MLTSCSGVVLLFALLDDVVDPRRLSSVVAVMFACPAVQRNLRTKVSANFKKLHMSSFHYFEDSLLEWLDQPHLGG